MDKLLCNDCPCSVLEPWTGGKQAMRCMEDGPWHGREVGLMREGHEIEVEAPAWCKRREHGDSK